MAIDQQLEIIKSGVEIWNLWKLNNPKVRVDLTGADLNGAELPGAYLGDAWLTGVDLQGANLSGAFLRDSDLSLANFSGANCREAKFSGSTFMTTVFESASLQGADFSRTTLFHTDFTSADLTGARLESANLVQAVVERAILKDCTVYGVSVWDLKGTPKEQSDLVITSRGEAAITVDNLEVAQFVYLMLNNEKIRSVLTTIGEKGVLLLGRFTPERKQVLDSLRNKLRDLNYVPMMFDFDKADDRSFTETIRILAGLSRFVIADVTNPRCTPLELQATVPDYMVPFVPIIQKGEEPFSMLEDLQRYEWVMSVKEYRSIDQLLEKLESKIIEPALKLHARLQLKKAQGILKESLDD